MSATLRVKPRQKMHLNQEIDKINHTASRGQSPLAVDTNSASDSVTVGVRYSSMCFRLRYSMRSRLIMYETPGYSYNLHSDILRGPKPDSAIAS